MRSMPYSFHVRKWMEQGIIETVDGQGHGGRQVAGGAKARLVKARGAFLFLHCAYA